MVRRWRVVVVDDNNEGTLETALLCPLVLPEALPEDTTSEELEALVQDHPLNELLPLEPGETYAQFADIQFQLLRFDERRKECSPRFPMIEVERDFGKAWKLVDDLAKSPPDIIFLDVKFEQKATPLAEVESIIDEVMSSDRIGRAGRPGVMEVLSRGGLFLLGKLLQTMHEVRQMPLVILYSASREVQIDFLPFEYATEGRLEVIEKSQLKNGVEERKQVFRRRIRDYVADGTIRADQVQVAIDHLSSADAIAGEPEAVERAMRHPVGSGWVFGTLFPGECIDFLSREPDRRAPVVQELQDFIAPLIGNARSFVDFMVHSPARLFSHDDRVRFSPRPAWLRADVGDSVPLRIAANELNGDLPEVRKALAVAVQRLPMRLRQALGNALGDYREDGESAAQALDRYVGELTGYATPWSEMLNLCRMKSPVGTIASAIGNRVNCTLGDLNEDGFELCLAPSDGAIKQPLDSLLNAILNGVQSHAYKWDPDRRAVAQFFIEDSPAALRIEISDEGPGFQGLRHYEPYTRGGDLSTALVAAAEWFEVEIHSGGIRKRAATRGTGEVEPSPVTVGTKFVMRIPAYRLEV